MALLQLEHWIARVKLKIGFLRTEFKIQAMRLLLDGRTVSLMLVEDITEKVAVESFRQADSYK